MSPQDDANALRVVIDAASAEREKLVAATAALTAAVEQATKRLAAPTSSTKHSASSWYDSGENARTVRLLCDSRWQATNAQTFEGLRHRLLLMAEAGIPPMTVVPARTIEELGHIPRSDEFDEHGLPYAVDALSAVQKHGE